ncbi:MAG: COP9 signalosome catalytic subunit rri1 [Chrysothrix sp. TS-e1954]|nr:MAG: COP9 signalosome catalytic subunit rri1 [Chrysothrix sp. TS-e1954]
MATAQTTWELENAIKLTDPHRDALYNYDPEAQKAENEARPWRQDPHYFKHVRISAVALLKMVMHARSGGSIEIMGIMQGYTTGDTFIVTDAVRLPVEGTETRVNAQAEASEYVVQYLERSRQAGQLENAVGWYHSHPGYGCWLSGIDVSTQMLQQYQDPFCAIVVDPDRTISAGKVEIGAFRTFPQDYKPEKGANGEAGADGEGFETIPLGKIEDFGAHADRYYSMSVSHFKSTLDAKLLEALWEKYWVGTLSASPLFSNREYGTKQMTDLALKIGQHEKSRDSGRGGAFPTMGLGKRDQKDEQLAKIVRAGDKIAAEEEAGLMASEIKRRLFNGIGTVALEQTQLQDGEIVMTENGA